MNMLRLQLCVALLASALFVVAQTELPAERSRTMPYPVTNVYDDPAAQDFVAGFNVTDVGNLHVYDAELADAATAEDYMQGVAIAPTAYRFLPKAIKKQMSSGHKVYAVHSIRGEGQEYLLVKHPPLRGGVEYGLYAFDGERMQHLVDLAGYSCNGSSCTQMDSWIRDIDGDTRLDVIQKKKRPNGKTVMKVYMQTDDGRFKRTRRALDPVQYPMQEKS